MLSTYRALARLALDEFGRLVINVAFLGGTEANPNKLRLILRDASYLDIWLSEDGDYAFHWEQRRQTGRMYRWDNAPHHPYVSTFPAHFHDGDEHTTIASDLNAEPDVALRQILGFIEVRL